MFIRVDNGSHFVNRDPYPIPDHGMSRSLLTNHANELTLYVGLSHILGQTIEEKNEPKQLLSFWKTIQFSLKNAPL